jgi:hypothetical protein
MTTFDDPVADAAEVRRCVRGLAHATRGMQDPTTIHGVIGSLSTSLASMAQVLHQLGATHDRLSASASQGSIGREGRATAYQASWELHRAAEMVSQVATAVDRVHQLEAAITYAVQLPTAPAPAAGRAHSLSL